MKDEEWYMWLLLLVGVAVVSILALVLMTEYAERECKSQAIAHGYYASDIKVMCEHD